ncbi:MAG: Aminotransferase [Bacteroidetes bacterium]|nr:Aminotransferase [Bacteroidota bacterium]
MQNTSDNNGYPTTIAALRREIVGLDTKVPVLDGGERPYVYLDNGASTPTFKRVLQCIQEFMPWYSGVHRGTGFKSWIATDAYDKAHDVVGRFVGADLASNLVTFTKNTTESVNKLASRFRFQPNDVVVTTSMEHHSNDLPWRKHATVIHAPLLEYGYLDMNALKTILDEYRGRVRLVAVTGASNITGICSPIHQIAELAHAVGARVFVDAAQLAPHRPINILPNNSPQHIDFLAFSAHKMYAPFGTGVLIGPTEFFEESEPDAVGGGVAAIVTLDDVQWNHVPHNDEAGSPNVVGGIALAEACCMLQSVGLDAIAAHEQHLLDYTYKKLRKIPGMVFYGPTETLEDKVGVIAFNMEGLHPGLVGAILSVEGGIGVRNGYFCAQPYVKKLLSVSDDAAKDSGCGVATDDLTTFPGMVRASFGCYSNEADADALVEMLGRISRKEYQGNYVQDHNSGRFSEERFTVSLKKYFPYLVSAAASEREYSESA